MPIALLVCLLLLEIAPRISATCESWVEPGDRLGSILRLFERHPTRVWTLRRGLKTEFAGAPVVVNDLAMRGPAPAGDLSPPRVLCLGESLCFGWGVEFDQTYSQLVEEQLSMRTGKAVEVINAGTPGYTTHQGLIQLQELGFDLQPDLVVVPFVVNDIDRLRFFRNDGQTDAELGAGSRASSALSNLLGHSYTFLLYQRALLGTLRKMAGPQAEARALAMGMKCRVPAGDYEINLRTFVAECRKRDVPLLFVVQPLHLPLPEIDGEPAEVQPLLSTLAADREALSPAEARQVLEHSRGRLHETLDRAIEGSDEQVRSAIDRSREWDAYRCRAQAIRYNAIMRRVASDEGVPLADVTAAMAHRRAVCAEGVGPCGGPLYRDAEDDPIHPTAEGHRVYAHVIFRAIAELW